MKPTTRSLLAAMSIWCLLLLAFRAYYWNSRSFFFLPYNLVLAAIPLAISHLIVNRNAPWKPLLAAVWLLFFPNALYILTDLMHLAQKRDVPLFIDVALLLSFAGTGAAFGFLSLQQLQNQIAEKGHARASWIFAIGCLFLASFGIYLGRVVRLNSWDVIMQPHRLVASISAPILNPAGHLSTWAMTLSFGVLLSLAYGFFVSGSGVAGKLSAAEA